MRVRMKMPKKLELELAASYHSLQDFIEDQRYRLEFMSEQWQQGDRGLAVLNWLDDLDEVAYNMEDFRTSAL
ncbi:hypothetical protein MFUR16E_17525 [Methylobacterium fujisawaense]|uniref:Rx N-terminal domain-containing protein n=2 Tax=Methylobacteriaceae TaxID=119045 RepID=A0ABU7TLJ4_9HYPH|nr:hypothetical protein A3862_05185 [Methylobacterium sp. XJLW]SDA28025.1 hypothetical protein SAMN02799622_04212 [Methylobacterium sp. UNC378MF]